MSINSGHFHATGVAKTTVLRLLAEAGEFAAFYHDFMVKGVRAPRQEFDEQWSFVGAHKNRTTNPEFGDVWTFVCLATESKLVISYLCGERSRDNTYAIVEDAAARTHGITDICTDGWSAYREAISLYYTWKRANYTQVIKEYDNADKESMRRYGPAKVRSISKIKVLGTPDMDVATTSYVENLNLHTRQKCRRFARLTNQHSKSAANHTHAVALHCLRSQLHAHSFDIDR